jgi:hypothetical protein
MSETAASFSVVLHNQATRTFGSGRHVGRIVANNSRGTRALATLDMNAMGEAYLAGDIDVEGDLEQLLSVRTQFRNRKGSVDPAALAADQVDDYGRMTGALLARAHSHSADPRLIAGYCGKSDELDEAVATFAVTYADRTEADHADLVTAVRAGRVAAEMGV